jgi:hypothetical protein
MFTIKISSVEVFIVQKIEDFEGERVVYPVCSFMLSFG